MHRRFATLLRMGSAERDLLVETTVITFLTWFGIRMVGLPCTTRWLRRWFLKGIPLASDADATIIASVQRSQRLLKRGAGSNGTCLVRSLTLWTLLRRRGVGCELKIGFRKVAGRFEGHAWIEHLEIPINDDPGAIAEYSPFASGHWFFPP